MGNFKLRKKLILFLVAVIIFSSFNVNFNIQKESLGIIQPFTKVNAEYAKTVTLETITGTFDASQINKILGEAVSITSITLSGGSRGTISMEQTSTGYKSGAYVNMQFATNTGALGTSSYVTILCQAEDYHNHAWSIGYAERTITNISPSTLEGLRVDIFSTKMDASDHVGNHVTTSISGKVVITYQANYAPVVTNQSPSSNQFFNGNVTIRPTISVSDGEGQTLTCKYYVDSETTPRETKLISNTSTGVAVSFTGFSSSTLSDGQHSVKYEVSDAFPPVILSIPFFIDKTSPTLGTISNTSTDTSITATGSATDAIAGLDAYPYRYTIGTVTSWIANSSYAKSGLIPNTQYTAKFEARDKVGNIASSTKSLYTKAAVPSLSISNSSPYSLNVKTSDNNPSITQYQISVNNGSKYVTPEGTLTISPVWITLPNKNITVTGLSPSATYSFIAKAKNAENFETAWSAPVSGTTLIKPPNEPGNITATATTNSINVVWDPVAGSTGYDIEVDGVIKTNGTYTSYVHTGLNPYTQHSYRIRAKNAGGTGEWSQLITKYTEHDSPSSPFNIDTAATNTSIIVTWQPIPGATVYDIEVDGVVVNNSSSTNYVHTGLIPGTMHSYRVRSINSGGKSDWSHEIIVSTQTEVPPIPGNIVVEADGGQIIVTWDAVEGATYEIEVDGNIKDNGISNSFVHTGLEDGSEHSYRIRVIKSGSTSDWSDIETATVSIPAFGTPTNIKAEATDKTVTLSWAAMEEAIRYEVEADGIVMDNGIETSCVFSSLEPATPYTYRVRAIGVDQESEWSEVISVVTYALPTPTNIHTLATGDIISINWDQVEGAESYDLDIDGDIVEDIGENSYTFEGEPNSQYGFRVRAVNSEGTSNWSIRQLISILQNETDVVVDAITKSGLTSITIIWNPVDEVREYEIEIDGTITQNVIDNAFVHSDLTPGTVHTYRVRAVIDSGNASWNEAIQASTLPDSPAIPSDFTASSTTSSVLVTWSKVDNAIEYELEVDGVVINVGSGTSYLHKGLMPSTQHSYRIRAISTAVSSEWSTPVMIETKASLVTYNIETIVGETFNLAVTSQEIDNLTKYTYTITYNPEELEVIDLYSTTSRIDLTTGMVIGSDIQVVQFESGIIVFKKLGFATDQLWTGFINSIKFKSKGVGVSNIEYRFD
ncbi:MAG TPA: galactose oxidase [Patescibacteria group bacterium]|nr:galactose oxidase [Patescibacteria group bacterium]